MTSDIFSKLNTAMGLEGNAADLADAEMDGKAPKTSKFSVKKSNDKNRKTGIVRYQESGGVDAEMAAEGDDSDDDDMSDDDDAMSEDDEAKSGNQSGWKNLMGLPKEEKRKHIRHARDVKIRKRREKQERKGFREVHRTPEDRKKLKKKKEKRLSTAAGFGKLAALRKKRKEKLRLQKKTKSVAQRLQDRKKA